MIDLDRFSGIGRLYGASALQRIAGAHVMVVGIGGVGSWTVEALARSGVGRLTLVDLDDICVTNTNRQLHTTAATIGQPKATVMADRARAIHPGLAVEAVEDFLTRSTADALLDRHPDVIVDAIDSLPDKCVLLAGARDRGIAAVTVGAAGGRRDPTAIRVTDLLRTSHDPLLRRVRRELRAEHGFDPDSSGWQIPAVYSTEPAVYPGADGETCDRPDPSQTLRLDCGSGFGTVTMVTGTFGFVAASAAIDRLLAAADPLALV